MSENIDYMVSVRLMTYNHARFIRRAMDSIMMQEVDFFVEVVVGDDFSQDNTLDIIREYGSSSKIHVRILERQVGDRYWRKRQKLGRLYNFSDIINNCQGKYIALLDGDDYWTDSRKLKKQTQFLQAYPEYVLAGCGAFRVDVNDELLEEIELVSERDLSFVDIATKNPFVSASIIFRYASELKRKLSNDLLLMDRTLCLYLSQFGKTVNMPDVMVAYRMNPSGVHSGSSVLSNRLRTLTNFERLLEHLTRENQYIIRNMIIKNHKFIIKKMLATRNYKAIIYCLKLLKHVSALFYSRVRFTS